jgi:hypothetical protein
MIAGFRAAVSRMVLMLPCVVVLAISADRGPDRRGVAAAENCDATRATVSRTREELANYPRGGQTPVERSLSALYAIGAPTRN